METLAFTPLGDDRVPGPLANLTLSLVVAPQQKAADAIAFSLRIENRGTSPVAIHNPYDVLTYHLANGAGWPITTRSPPSRIKVGRPVDRSDYLGVREVRVNGEAVADPAALLSASDLIVAPGGTTIYELRIARVAAPEGKDGPTTVVADEYTLSCLLSLIGRAPSEAPGATLTSGQVRVVVR
jgi:hypothetical protein